MNKICTSIEQSKKLAEILPIKNADMEYMFLKRDGSEVSNVPFVKDGFEEPECCYIFIPCWSLTALLSVLPVGSDIVKEQSDDKDGKYMCTVGYKNDVLSTFSDNPVDACYEMILKLNELKML